MRLPRIGNLFFRTIDPRADADLAARNHLDACVATYGDDRRYEGRDAYLRYLRNQVELYPDGSVLAFEGDGDGPCVGQLELQVPYGSPAGYVSLFYVAGAFRGRGYADRLNDYAERYFRAWEATSVALHVAATNGRAVGFYRRNGYRFVAATEDPQRGSLWTMRKDLSQTVLENGPDLSS